MWTNSFPAWYFVSKVVCTYSPNGSIWKESWDILDIFLYFNQLCGVISIFIANTWKVQTSENLEVCKYTFHPEPPSDFHTNVTSRDFGTHIPLMLGIKYLDERKSRLEFSIQVRMIVLRIFSVSGKRNLTHSSSIVEWWGETWVCITKDFREIRVSDMIDCL